MERTNLGLFFKRKNKKIENKQVLELDANKIPAHIALLKSSSVKSGQFILENQNSE